MNSNITSIEENQVHIKTPDGNISVENETVLALTGYHPNFKFLENCGITFSNDELKTPTYNPETMETNVDGLYLAGVVCGGKDIHLWFIENSRIHANFIVKHILSKNIKI